MNPTASALLVLLLLAVVPAPAGGQAPDVAILGLHVTGDPQWIHGEAVGEPTVHFTVRNRGTTPIPGYTIEYLWVQDGRAEWLRGSQQSSTDPGPWGDPPRSDLGSGQSRQHSQSWSLQDDQRGDGAVRIRVTVGTQTSGNPGAQATVSLSVPVHEVELSVPGQGQTIRPLETRFLRVHVANHGNVPETVTLERTAHADPAGRLADLSDHLQYEALIVPPGGAVVSPLFIDYRFSGDHSPFTAWYTLRAATAYGRTLEATTPVLSSGQGDLPEASTFRLERVDSTAPTASTTVPADAAATVEYRITNTGASADTYRVTALPATGWSADLVLPGATPPSGGGLRAALEPGGSLDFQLQVQAPADAAPGTPADVTLRVTSDRRPTQPADASWPFRVGGPAPRVEPAGDWDAPVYVGDDVRVAVRLHNDGDEATTVGTLRLRILPAPGAQPILAATVEAPAVLPGRSAVVEMDAGTYREPGPAHLLVHWSGAEVHAQGLERERFLREAAASLTPPAALAGAPGELVGYRAGDHVLLVRNAGNAEETFRASVLSGDAVLVSDPVFTLAPGQQRSLSLDHRVPLPAGGLDEVEATFQVTVADRPDLAWSAAVTTRVEDVNAPALRPVHVPALWNLGVPLEVEVVAEDDSAVSSVRLHHTGPAGAVTVHDLADAGSSRWVHTLLPAAGNHTLALTARDAHGNEATLAAVPLEVRPVPPPAVRVLGAGDGARLRPDATLQVHVEDDLPIHSVRVEARDARDRVLWQRDLVPDADPIGFDLRDTPPGVVTLVVEVTNSAGSSRNQSLAVTILDATPPRPDVDMSGNAAPAPALWAVLAAVLTGARARRRPAEAVPGRTPRARPPLGSRRPHPQRAARWAAVLLVVTLTLGLPLAPADATTLPAVDPVALEWWGPTAVGEGFHVRFPVTVHNQRDHPVTNGAVLAEVDVAAKLVEAGWVSQARSGTDLLRSFELDDASVRVVAMTNLDPMRPGTTDGLLGVHTTEYRAGDPRRHEVPSTHFTGSLSGAGEPFDPDTNPYLTVLWRVGETLQPGEERHYVVYIDSTTNREEPHTPLDYRGVPGGALLERTFWSGPGVDLAGVVAPEGQAGTVTVVGLHDDTTVQVLLGNSAGTFIPQADASTHTNPLTIDRHEFRQLQVSNTQITAFRLVASKPVLAYVDGEGYVPTPTGHTVGNEFLFSTTHAASVMQDSLFFHNHAPGEAETVVRLERMTSEGWVTDQQVSLSDGDNLLPYTIGSRGSPPQSSGGSCTFPPSPSMAVVDAGRAHYRATVIQGGPVSLQLQPATGLTQLPAADGAPTGTTFWSALSRASNDPSNCGALRQYNVYATASDSTALGLSNPESRLERISPRCTDAPCDGHPVGPLPGEAMTQKTFSGTDDLPERPFRLDVDDPAWLMVAPSQPVASIAGVPLRGPLGGADAGRGFVGYGSHNGPPLLYAPYSDTTVQARIHYAAAGTQAAPRPLVQGQLSTLPTLAGDSILSYRLDADRPIIVLPRGASTGFLGGIPATLAATVHGADYRGHLVEIESTTELDPVSGSTVPGEPITYSFQVTNRGRSVGAGDLADTIDLGHTELPDGWEARLSRTSMPLRSGETQSVHLTVTPGLDAEPGQLASVSVQATSRGNPQVAHSVDTVTHIKRSFDVGVWFDQAGVGPKVDRGFAAAGEPVDYRVVVQNLGTVADTVALDVSRPDGEWQALLLRGGQAVAQVHLEPREAATLTLRVVPPAGLSEGFLQTTVTAQSTSSPAVVDRVFALSRIQAPSDLRLEVEDRTRWLEPGGQAVFNVTVSNQGGTTEVFLDLRADLLPGWTEPVLFLRQVGQDQSVDRLSIGSGEVLQFGVAINASADAATGDLVSTRLHAGAAGQEGGLEAFLHAVVRPVHRVDVEAPSLPLHAPRGGVTLPVELRLTNNGSMPERLVPAAASLPAGWGLEFPAQEVLLPRDATQVLRIGLVVPRGAAEGEHAVAVALTSLDGARTEVDLPVVVGAFADHARNGTDRLAGQPGRTAWVEHTVRNDGNTPLQVHVEAVDGEPWTLDGTISPLPLPPGAEVVVRISWRVPADAPDGATRHRADVVLRSASPDVEPVRDTVEVEVDVGRPALRVVSTDGFPGAAGTVVQVRIANEGSRTAHDVAVVLRVGQETVDRVVVAELPPGDARNVTLLRPEGWTGAATVVLDPDRAVVEADHADNVHAVPDVAARAAPGPAGAFLGALLASVAAARSLAARRRGDEDAGGDASGHTMAGNDLCAEDSPTTEWVGGCAPGGPDGGMMP